MANSYDVAVIGAGPGGYVAAIRCAQLGLKTVCIDEWHNPQGKPALGGTCLNVGCIPSKALLESSELYAHVQHGLAEHGIKTLGASFDLAQMQQRKTKIVEKSTGGIAFLFRKNKVEWRTGTARFIAPGQPYRIEISQDARQEQIEARCVIVASGSVPTKLKQFPVDGERVLDSADALALTEVPKRLGIIGAGVIGLEMGSIWRRLGSEVTLFDASDVFLRAVDNQIAAEAWKLFTSEQGFAIQLGVKLKNLKVSKDSVSLDVENAQGTHSAEFDRLLVATGRSANTAGLNAAVVGLKLSADGRVEVDAECRSNLPDVYAIGDCVRGPMLAHKASEEGLAVAERLAGQRPQVNEATIPSVIYTAPEIAWVGQTEQDLKTAGTGFRKGIFWFMANGRAQALGETRGLIKVLADETTDRILGVHMIGPRVSELLAEAVVAMEFAAAAEDIARISHAHPTLSEALREACLAALGRPLHQ